MRQLTIRAILGIVAVLAATAVLTLRWLPDRSTPLVSVHSGKCVSVFDGNIEEARAFQLGCTDQSDNRWYLQKIVEDDVGGAPYRIVNISNSKCLSISDELFSGARVIVQRSCANGNKKDQLWIFDLDEDRGNGWIYGQFVNMQKWHCLDINGGELADGAPVIEWPCAQGSNQRFRVPKEAIS
ncbi:MAG: RICIN domain-containing protein [Pseudonocardiaceae bacterium]